MLLLLLNCINDFVMHLCLIFPVCRHGVHVDFYGTEPENQSVVYVGVDNELAGLIYIEDEIREDARHVIETLSNGGIDVYMLSGDKRSTAEYVASLVGIPREKVKVCSTCYW